MELQIGDRVIVTSLVVPKKTLPKEPQKRHYIWVEVIKTYSSRHIVPQEAVVTGFTWVQQGEVVADNDYGKSYHAIGKRIPVVLVRFGTHGKEYKTLANKCKPAAFCNPLPRKAACPERLVKYKKDFPIKPEDHNGIINSHN